MSNITLRDGSHHIGALLRHTPVTAARNGVLAVVHDALLCAKLPELADELATAAAPLATALGASELSEVDGALCALNGRPPAVVTRTLTSPELVAAMCAGLDSLGLIDLSNQVARWGPRHPADRGESVPLSRAGWAARVELTQSLRQRAMELIAEWRRSQRAIGGEVVAVDGRSLIAAARAWQVPMITGEVPAMPLAAAALHPNRLGRTAAVVAYSKLSGLIRSPAPDSAVFEPLALLVAVAESISVPVTAASVRNEELSLMQWDTTTARTALRGDLRVQVRVGEPVGTETLDFWWPVFSSWGSTSKRLASAIPTAWRLTNVEADVLVWALCSVAVRASVAASMPSADPSMRKLGERVVPWEEHRAMELPRWEEGVRSVWGLMQSARRFADRSEFPGALVPSLDSDQSWPWYSPWDD